MTLASKAELRADVGNWLNRSGDSDFLSRFDSFLALCEADFGSKLRADVMERRQDAALNERWEKNPAGTNQIRSVMIVNDGIYQKPALTFLPYVDIVRAYGETSATPVKAYTLVGEQIGFFPFPLQDFTSTLRFEVTVYQRPNALVLDTDSNLVLTTYPSVYLYGVLMQTAPYYGRDDDLAKWGQAYQAAIEAANFEAASTPGDILLERVS